MTDNEIIQALEYCTGYPSCPTDCPLYEQPMDCLLKLSKPTLDLINRQKAEIEMWKSSAELWEGDTKDLFISREQIKAEAVKEFSDLSVERIRKNVTPIPQQKYLINMCIQEIENTKKEMVGDTDV